MIKLLRVDAHGARPFVAGLDVERGVITQTAPILKWARGLTEIEFRKRCRLKGWRVDEVPLQGRTEMFKSVTTPTNENGGR